MTFIDHLARRGATAEIARAMGVTHAAVRQWRDNGVPADRVLDLERLTGISRHTLRPDVFGPPTVMADAAPQQAAAKPRIHPIQQG